MRFCHLFLVAIFLSINHLMIPPTKMAAVELNGKYIPTAISIGDGDFIMSNRALCNAARYQIPVTVIVCNNRQYKAVKDGAIRFKGKALEKNNFIGSSIDNPAPDLAQMAESFGVTGYTIKKPSQIKSVLNSSINNSITSQENQSTTTQQSLQNLAKTVGQNIKSPTTSSLSSPPSSSTLSTVNSETETYEYTINSAILQPLLSHSARRL